MDHKHIRTPLLVETASKQVEHGTEKGARRGYQIAFSTKKGSKCQTKEQEQNQDKKKKPNTPTNQKKEAIHKTEMTASLHNPIDSFRHEPIISPDRVAR